MADGLPALGIVAAVLGVIKTMGSITEPPEVLGSMIGGALVGTFLGVFLAYGMVGPMATRMKAVIEEEARFYKIIQSVLVAHLHGNAAQISVEIGRGNVPSAAQPSFLELEEALGAIPAEGLIDARSRRREPMLALLAIAGIFVPSAVGAASSVETFRFDGRCVRGRAQQPPSRGPGTMTSGALRKILVAGAAVAALSFAACKPKAADEGAAASEAAVAASAATTAA